MDWDLEIENLKKYVFDDDYHMKKLADCTDVQEPILKRS